MKKKLILAAIYLLGCVLGYFLLKRHTIFFNTSIHKPIIYSVKDRTGVLFLSLYSWGAVVGGTLLYISDSMKKDTPANW